MEPEPLEDEASDSGRKDYNAVLEFYVQENDDELDLVGLVAYALYKRQKRDWMVEHRKRTAGGKPSAEQVAAITTNYLTPDVRHTLRDRATDLLSGYAETYVEALEPEIRADTLNNEVLRQAREIENHIRSSSGFWRQVGTGLVATVIWTALVTILIIAALAFGSDVIDAWVAARSGT